MQEKPSLKTLSQVLKSEYAPDLLGNRKWVVLAGDDPSGSASPITLLVCYIGSKGNESQNAVNAAQECGVRHVTRFMVSPGVTVVANEQLYREMNGEYGLHNLAGYVPSQSFCECMYALVARQSDYDAGQTLVIEFDHRRGSYSNG